MIFSAANPPMVNLNNPFSTMLPGFSMIFLHACQIPAQSFNGSCSFSLAPNTLLLLFYLFFPVHHSYSQLTAVSYQKWYWLFPCLPACSVLCFVLMSGAKGIWYNELVTEMMEELRSQSGRGGNRRLAAIARPRAGGLKGGSGVTRPQGPGFPRDI